jgi:hypothetical protein
MQSLANGSQLTEQNSDEPTSSSSSNSNASNSNSNSNSNSSSNSDLSLNSIGIHPNGNSQTNGFNHCCDDISDNIDNNHVNIKSRTDQDIIRLIGQHLRVLGLKYVFIIVQKSNELININY